MDTIAHPNIKVTIIKPLIIKRYIYNPLLRTTTKAIKL